MAGHHDEDALLALLASTGSSADAHLAACIECRDKLESFRMVAEVLAEEEIWDRRPLNEAPNPNTIATLRAFADQMAAEDAAAETYMAALLAGPRETWAAKLEEHPEWRTAGMVRRLIEAVPAALDTMPPDAVAMTSLAANIAESLDPAAQTDPDTVSRLRGAAYREHAYALFYTGAFPGAEHALLASERHFSDCVVEEYDLARVGIVRALVEKTMERYGRGRHVARQSARVFYSFGDATKIASARLAEVHLLFSVSDFVTAHSVLQDLERALRPSDDADTHARVLGNLGYCCWKLGKIEDALRFYNAAATVLDALKIHTEAVRLRWSVASILAAEGRIEEALTRLELVRTEFERLGMMNVMTLASLDIAELLLTQERFDDVAAICRTAMRSFEQAGLTHTARALTALALLHEATQNRTATITLVREVRHYVKRLPENENLLFVLPPA